MNRNICTAQLGRTTCTIMSSKSTPAPIDQLAKLNETVAPEWASLKVTLHTGGLLSSACLTIMICVQLQAVYTPSVDSIHIQAHCPSCVNNACFVFFHYAVNLTHNSTLIFYLSIKTTASSHLCDCMYYFKQSNYYNFHSNYYNFHRPSQYLPVNISYPAFIT